MEHEQASPTVESSGSPQVRWLLKPTMEVEAAARWFCCHKEPDDTEADKTEQLGDAKADGAEAEVTESPGGQETDGSKGKPCYLCPGYKSRGESERECWRNTYVRLREVLDDILARTFPDKSTVTVIDWLRSFTSPYDRPTLRVEVIESDKVPATPEAHIVKLALAGKISPKEDPDRAKKISARLDKELAGYGYLGNHGKGKISPIFASLELGCRDDEGLQSLKYSDAKHTLRAGETVVTLERAILDACTGSQRSLDSVKATVTQLFAELEDAWYRHAQARAAPTTDADYLKQRLKPGLQNWLKSQTEAGRARDEVLWALRGSNAEFIDPALYFNQASWPPVPEMLVGTSHGDLHGRNVLVGIVEGEARWPVVFDYEDVLCCNPVAWDFVKLETELKKVALSDPAFLPASNDADFIQRLYTFELGLNEQTENCYNHNNWAAPLRDQDTPRTRLAHVILTIRRMAWKCLELRRGRSRKWLHEYYFLLAAYGVYAARFPVFREVRPLKSLFIGAGIAAYRHAYGEDLGQQLVALRRVDALDWIAEGCSAEKEEGVPTLGGAGIPGPADERRPVSVDSSGRSILREGPWGQSEIRAHRGDLAYAKQLDRSRNVRCVDEAIRLLRCLMSEHPFVLELAYECAFALLESAQLAQLDKRDGECEKRWCQADRFLKRAEKQFRGQMHQELVSRRGRLYKDQADDRLAKNDLERAKALYEQAAKSYVKAAEVTEDRNKYYPGINAATCWWLAGRTTDANKWANNVLKWVTKEEEALPKGESGEQRMWVLATKGEALVIAGISGGTDWCDEGKVAYGGALDIAKREGELKHHSSTMIQQLERILKVARDRKLKNVKKHLKTLMKELLH